MHQFFVFLSIFMIFTGQAMSDHWDGKDYAHNSSVQLSHAEWLLNRLPLTGDENILDIGCGDGKITALLAKRVPQGMVIGIDPSDSMLDKAELTCRENNLPHLHFQKGSAEEFSLEQRFDHIIAIHVMHWIKEQEKALKNIKHHLSPQGHVHFILAPSKEGLPFHRALQKTVRNWEQYFVDFTNPQQVFDMETYRKLMVTSGFRIEAMHYLHHESTHANKEKLQSWVKQWQPHAKHLPDEIREDFLRELINNYLIEVGLDPEISSPVKWEEYVLIVEAR